MSKIRKMRLVVAVTLATLVASAAPVETMLQGVAFGEMSRNKWRVTVGPAFNFNVRARIGVRAGYAIGITSGMMPSVPASKDTKQSVLDVITGAADPNGVKRYEGGAWINPSDSAHNAGETWNFKVPSAEQLISEGQLTLRSANYVQSASTISTASSVANASESGDYNAPGLNVEVSRELFYDPEWRFGMDFAFGFTWFFNRKFMDGGGEIYRRTQTETTTTGYFTETFDVSDMEDPYGNYPIYGGILGAGTFAGPGPVLKFPGSIVDIPTSPSSKTDVSSVGAYYRGRYNEFEFTAALRPFYEPWEWMRIYGTIGLGVSYMRLSFDEQITVNGATVYDNDHVERNWDVFGVGGLGAQFRYEWALLGFDFTARFLHDDMDVDSQLLRGSLSRGDWMFRCYLGAEF